MCSLGVNPQGMRQRNYLNDTQGLASVNPFLVPLNLNSRNMNQPFILFVSLLLSSIFIACNSTSPNISDKVNTQVLRVEAYQVQPEQMERNLNLTGSLLAEETVELKAEIAGKIVAISFVEGSTVKKGQLLFKIDDRELQAQKAKTFIELKLAASEFKRSQELLKIEAISQEEYDAIANRKASLQADLALLQARIDRCSIEAPFDAYAGLRYKSPGAFVQVGEVLGNLVQNQKLRLEFDVPDKFASFIKKGQLLEFTVSGGDEVYQAEVYAHSGAMNTANRNLKVRAHVDNKKGELLPGAFTEINLNLGESEGALLIPAECLTPELKGEKVWLIRNGMLQPEIVRTGIRKPTRVQIVEGLNAGDTVITTGLLQAKPGIEVSIIKVSKGI